MKYLLVLLTLFTFNDAFGQRTRQDSLAGNMYLDKYVNRYMDSLESTEDKPTAAYFLLLRKNKIKTTTVKNTIASPV